MDPFGLSSLAGDIQMAVLAASIGNTVNRSVAVPAFLLELGMRYVAIQGISALIDRRESAGAQHPVFFQDHPASDQTQQKHW